MIDDVTRALSQLFDRKFQGVFWRSILLTILLLAGVYTGFVFLIDWAIPDTFTLPWIGEVDWLATGLSITAIVAMLILSMFLMFPVASVFIGFFLESIADAVEDKHYPGLPKVDPQPFTEMIAESLKFMLILIVANLLALVIYLLSTVLAPVIFYIVNGFLLGRESFHLVAARRLGNKEAAHLRKKYMFEIWLTGIVMAIPLSIPVVNLFVPILGVAVFTHQFHRLNAN